MVGKGLPILKNALKQLEGLPKSAAVGTSEVFHKAFHHLTSFHASRLVFAYISLILLYVIMMLILTDAAMDLLGFSTSHRLPPYVELDQLKHFNNMQDVLMIVSVVLGVNFLLAILIFLIYLLVKLRHVEAPLSGALSYFAHPVLKYIFGIISYIFVFVITVFSILRVTCADAGALVQDLEVIGDTAFSNATFNTAVTTALKTLVTECTTPYTSGDKCTPAATHLLTSLESKTRRLWTNGAALASDGTGVSQVILAIDTCWMTKEITPVVLLILFILYVMLHIWLTIRSLRKKKSPVRLDDDHLPLMSYEDDIESDTPEAGMYAIPPGSTIPGIQKWNYNAVRS
ncbi:ORF59 [black bullhead herpesvirus]|uniref:ORF59 n=1 Tax=black bullhead herpesvirus TaxID=508441 RepID=D5FM47_9VIRU|nr:ORF59 [black bullhead herpesvirus]ACZ55874.1 ORF59 [black bullhead herpesvirus]